MSGNGKCSNCGNETEKRKDKCDFCLKFGGEDPGKLLEIKLFSECHYNRGICEMSDMD